MTFALDVRHCALHPDMVGNALNLIGGTRLVTLDRIHKGPGRIVAKAEYLQPGGSVKDRAALAIILDARAQGRLIPGQRVVSMTSGNFGSALAIVCNVLGHPLVITMSDGNSPQRARMIEALGAELILVPQVNGTLGEVTGADLAAATNAARQIAAERSGFYVDQFVDQNSIRAHEEGTGPELWQQLEGNIDGFVACVGSGGTFVGTARYLKQQRSEIVCGAVEPAGAEVLAGKAVQKPRHLLQGTGYGAIPPCWDPTIMDVSIAVTDDEAFDWRSRLARWEGLHVGFSAAANVCAAAKLLQAGCLHRDATVATVLCDTGLKY